MVGLAADPERIEGYDISHLRGGRRWAPWWFSRGRPDKDSYRHFHIRQAPAGDDYAALQEVLRRRVGRSEWPQPDLILIDDGKGQLHAARETLTAAGRDDLRLISLAKNPEQIFLEGAESR